MCSSMRVAVLAALALTFAHASRVQIREKVREVSETYECAEEAVRGICKCETRSSMLSGYQCSGCVDPNKWGYGCALDCPKACPENCDFSGNCIVDHCPTNCQHNPRMGDKTTNASHCLNELGSCQACESGFYGLMCKKACPQHCEKSKAEGACRRDGKCYKCMSGFYGPMCENACPTACPKCMQEDGLDDQGQQMPAGSCAQACQGDFYGQACDTSCPDNCDRLATNSSKECRCKGSNGTGMSNSCNTSGAFAWCYVEDASKCPDAVRGKLGFGGAWSKIPCEAPSCTRDAGVCKKCKRGFWGETCEKECGNCASGQCEQADGSCPEGCVPGFYGAGCKDACPEFTVMSQGCNRETGLPNACDAQHYPGLDSKKAATCLDCSPTCIDGECNDDSVCTKGCVEGFYGPSCDKTCTDGCEGGCDRETGQCHSCVEGKTGKFCQKNCHSQCRSCSQFAKSDSVFSGLFAAVPGDKETDCMSCPEDDASELSGAAPTSCQCIHASTRASANAKCTCDSPGGERMEGFFEKKPKQCSARCKNKYKGKELRAVYGDHRKECIYLDLYNSVVVAGYQNSGNIPNKGGEPCEADEYPIDVFGEVHCLAEDYAMFIMGKRGRSD